MKKLKVDKLTLPDRESVYIERKQYNVWLGNHSSNSFTNKKEAIKYLADTNRFINTTLQELNLIYIDVFAEYRRLWFVLNENNVEHYFYTIDKMFKNAVKFANTKSNNTYVFIDLTKICYEFKTIINLLIDKCLKIKNFVIINFLKTILNRIERINNDLENYGKPLP